MTPRDLTMAGILLVLRSKPCHGWEIAEHLRKLGMEVEMSALYRTLRGMEDKGLVSSYWADPVDGPRRRMYSIDSAGHQRLVDLEASIRGQRAMLDMVMAAIDCPEGLEAENKTEDEAESRYGWPPPWL